MKYHLDIKRSTPYIRESLVDGLELSRLLLDRVDKGDVVRINAHLPEGLSDEAIYDFRSGGLRLKVTSAVDTLPFRERLSEDGREKMGDGGRGPAAGIRRYLSTSSECCCVLEECNRTASDDLGHYWDRYSRAPLLSYGNELYHYLHHGMADMDLIHRTVSQADATWHFVGILSATPPQIMVSPRVTMITKEDLGYMCDKASVMIIGAYDGESWLECELSAR